MAFKKAKRKQIKKFFKTPLKMLGLRHGKPTRGRTQRTFKAYIGGEHTFVKPSAFEREQRKNLCKVLSLHAKCLRAGLISATRYKLLPNPYLYVDKRVGITKKIGEVSLQEVHNYLYLPAKQQAIFAKSDPRRVQAIKDFLEQNPKLSKEDCSLALYQLRNNLHSIKKARFDKSKFDISIDLTGDNAIIHSFDPKSRVFTLGLIDQIYPGNEKRIAKEHKRKRKRKRKDKDKK